MLGTTDNVVANSYAILWGESSVNDAGPESIQVSDIVDGHPKVW